MNQRVRPIFLVALLACAAADVYAQGVVAAAPAGLTVTSNPPGAVVIIDGRYAGPSPLSGTFLHPGLHVVVLRLKGFLTASDTVDVPLSGALAKEYNLVPACAATIASEPAGSSVYVDNVFQGMTPLVLEELKPGPTIIAIARKFYLTRIDTVDLSPGRQTRVTMTLRPMPATLSVNTPEEDVELSVNNQAVSFGSLRDTLVVPGDIEITARQRATGRLVSTTALLMPNATARFFVKYDLLSRDPFVSSLYFPGQGQRQAGSPILGWAMSIAFSGAVALAVGAELKGAALYSDYSSSRTSYDKAATKAEALAQHNTGQGQYDDARTAFKIRNIGLWTALAVYVLSAADAYFIHNRVDIIYQIPDDQRAAVPCPVPSGQPVSLLRVGVRL
jgi:hypothetical protein